MIGRGGQGPRMGDVREVSPKGVALSDAPALDVVPGLMAWAVRRMSDIASSRVCARLTRDWLDIEI